MRFAGCHVQSAVVPCVLALTVKLLSHLATASAWHIEIMLHSPAHSLCNVCRGFQMLAAMGYQQGKGLGKDESGRAAPVDVKLKSDRLGLGGEEAKKRKQRHLQQQQAEAGGLHSTCVAQLHALACCLYSCAVELGAACGSILSA